MNQMFSKKNHPQQCQSCTNQIDRICHPARSDPQQHITYRTATNGSYKTYHVRPEPVEPLCRSQPNATDGKSKRTYKVEYLNKCWHNNQ